MLKRLLKPVFCNVKNYSTKIGIVGAPFEYGQPISGVSQGPAALRDANLIQHIANIRPEMDVKDYGDVQYTIDDTVLKQQIPNVDMKLFAHMAAGNLAVSKKVQQVIKDGRQCITLGGDHSIVVGSIDGHLQAKNNNICLLWIDAHADLNTNTTSPSGNIHGMPLALLVKELADYWPYLPGMDWQKPVLSLRNVAYIGLRSIDSYERLVIEQFGLNAFGIEYVEDYGVSAVIKMALERIDPRQERSVHLSFDIDALDALEAPSTGTAVRGGLTLREGIHIVEEIHKTGRLGAMDLVEVNPHIGDRNDVKKTVEAAIHIIQSGCGYHRRGLIPYGNVTLPLPQ